MSQMVPELSMKRTFRPEDALVAAGPAYAISGQATVVPPRSVMNSRRRIAAPVLRQAIVPSCIKTSV
jgi:hypothetical protein